MAFDLPMNADTCRIPSGTIPESSLTIIPVLP